MSACETSCHTATRWLRAAQPDSRTRLCSGIWACCDCAMFTWGRVREPLVKSVGKPDARNEHVRFDERGRETGRPPVWLLGTAPFLDSTEADTDRAPWINPRPDPSPWQLPS